MNSKFVEWQASQTQALMTASTDDAFATLLALAARELGFEYCAFGMRMPLPLSNRKLFMANNYPTAWQQRYGEANYLTVDPTVAHGIKSVVPLVWGETAMLDTERPFWEDARAHGLKVGWAQSSVSAAGTVGMLTLARSNEEISAAELSENAMRMSWLVHIAHEGMAHLVAAKRKAEQPILLTAREIEVLRWTADGKTSNEVGQIMAISERTVNFHITNSLEKLGANNKTAGVVKAAMLRLL
ncbi:helix-turn-helix transcriptional regulator [Massilia atriviolacea]|nr:LuxR family transcriptional regulator [Massilia atriviolacea]